MIRNISRCRRGEGYVNVCIGVIAFVIVIVIAINIFSFITLRSDMEIVADELLETATYTGCFGADYDSIKNTLKGDYFDFDTAEGAESFFNAAYKRVQLGDTMCVEVRVTTYLRGVGAFKIPVTLTVKRSGISEKYWK
ncbi:MAG: DUF4320 family protein [Ruminiclostridium sp.]|nr:DUF4320 family protein [Ruminiclostridium sp.]